MTGKSSQGSVRIIAGQWRGRRLPVADIRGVRPSGDRSRETLFNWLQAHIPGAVCADLFAGTGALGFEAASRGAARVTLVDCSSRVTGMLEESVERLGATQLAVHHGDALRWLAEQEPQSLDIVFVDPPFADHLQEAVLERMEKTGCLRPAGIVYVESPASRPGPAAPAGWSTWREKVMGEVRMQVFRVGG